MPTSSPLSAELRAFAETPDRYTLLSGGVVRHDDERGCITQGPTWAGVSGVRVAADDVEGFFDEVRTRIPAAKRTTWWIGPSSEPDDLAERLLALGLTLPQRSPPAVHSLVCVEPPAPGAADVAVRRVETYEDFAVATEVAWEAFDKPDRERAEERPLLRRMFDAEWSVGVPMTFLASVDGRPAGVGRSIYSPRGVFLFAGGVLPWARRRGVYRALVRARWDDAVARGTPALVTEAIPDTSYPILLGLGFQEVCVTRRLEDPRSGPPAQ